MRTVKQELLALLAKDPEGILRVEAVHAWAKAHPQSALHKQIEWNATKAAREFQFWQIRRIILLNITTEEGDPEIVSLTIDRSKVGGGYRSIASVLGSKKLSLIMLQDAVQELERTKMKYLRVEQLTSVWNAVERVKARHLPRPKRSAAKKKR